ncbi:MAG: hypothetical protein WD801_12375 [Gemmatimonadaceae bacterium]
MHLIVLDTPYFTGSAALGDRIRAAETRYAWVSRLHTEAIREAIAERNAWPKRDRGNRQRICEQAMRLGFKYAAKANVANGRPAGSNHDNMQTVVQGLNAGGRCTAYAAALRPSSMSIFPTPPVLGNAGIVGATAQRGSMLETQLDVLVTTFGNSGSTGSEIVKAMNEVIVASEGSLTTSEFDFLIANAQLALSSLLEWQAHWDSGNWGGGGGGDNPPEDPMSVFRRQYHWVGTFMDYYFLFKFNKNARAVALADATGFAGGFRGGPVVAAAVAAMSSIAAYE